MSKPLDWTHDIAAANGAGCNVDREATQSERQALAKALGLEACNRLIADYKLKATRGDRISMTGRLKAEGQQACVVTGDPLPFTIDEPLDIEFTTAPSHEDNTTEEREVLSLRDVEVIEDAVIDAGRIVYEMVSVALDPYPRRAGVALTDHTEMKSDDAGADRPFAVLEKWKKPS